MGLLKKFLIASKLTFGLNSPKITSVAEMVRTLVVLIHQMTLTLINLAVLSCVGMGWFGILRNSEFEAVLNKTERSETAIALY